MPELVATPVQPAIAALKGIEPSPLRQWITTATMPWLSLLRAIRRWRRARQQWLELRQLDHCDLRDLGIDRSELASYDAEAAGTALSTRRRVSREASTGSGHGPE